MPSSFLLAFEQQNSVQAQWRDKHLLGLNSLSYGDGRVTLLRIYPICSAQHKAHYVFPIADTTIESIVKYNDDPWAEVELCRDRLTTGNTTFVCGEGAMGNEGFVAATNAQGLLWALFSTESNPFEKLELVGSYLKAYSDQQVYTINLENLTAIKVEGYDKYGLAG